MILQPRMPIGTRAFDGFAIRQQGGATQIDELLALLSKPLAACTLAERALKDRVLAGYRDLQNNAFRPHAVARTRHLAYQYCVVMK